MAEAILRGLLRSGMTPAQLLASDPDAERCAHLERELGIRIAPTNADVTRGAEVVVLAVKPALVEAATAALPREDGPLYVSIAAGRTTPGLRATLGDAARVVRAMPNTPALIGAGITAMAEDGGASEADLARAEAVLGAIGSVVRVPESQLDAVTGLSGSGPAYVYLLVEALSDAGVREGLPAAIAQHLAQQTVVGAARLLHETGEPPAVLRKRVTSPRGTTVAGLAALEAGGFRAALLAAVSAATARSRELALEG
jgi:pyrroline-5-carboxylate reductase